MLYERVQGDTSRMARRRRLEVLRTCKDVRKRAQEPVFRQRLHRDRFLRNPPVALKDALAAVRLEAAMQLKIDAGKVELAQHHARCLVRPAQLAPSKKLSQAAGQSLWGEHLAAFSL